MDTELEGLLEAARLLDQKRKEVCNEPMAVYKVVLHAAKYVDHQLDTMMRIGREGE